MNNIITEPKVYLVGKQIIDDASLNDFLSDENIESWETDTDIAGQKLIEVAGRLCYMSFSKPRPGGNSSYINHILEVGHGSVIEHSVYNFIVTGVSRSLTHELVRCRAGFSYSQLSQRFVDEGNCNFVEPACIAEDPELHEIWLNNVNESQLVYKKLSDKLFEKFKSIPDKTLRRKRAREAARSVLPNATETKIFFTANGRALRHFIEIRGDIHADQEIRTLAIKLMTLLKEDSTNIFGDYEFNNDELTYRYKKV